MQPPIRVGIVCNHRLFSEVMMASLHQEREIIFVEEIAIDKDGMIPPGYTIACNVVLVDAAMARINAVQLTRAIKQAAPTVQVIALGIEYNDDKILRFIEAGASGYILKNASYVELLYTIQAVHRGFTLCSPHIAALVFARIVSLAHQNGCHTCQQIRLTQREQQVLQLIALGYHNGEIAYHLDVALDTVKRHVANIFKKFQVHGRRALLHRAYQHGLLQEVRCAPSVGNSNGLQQSC